MDKPGPSLARRAIAAVVLVVVAIVLFKIVVGFIAAIFWTVAVVVLIVAALWAWATLRSGRRKRAPSAQVAAAPPEDLVQAQMRQIKEQLREQGRL
jgi:predicted membrane protein